MCQPKVLTNLTTAYPTDHLLMLKLNIMQLQDILATFTTTKVHFGQVNVVMNNAEYADLGEVEVVMKKDACAMFEMNYWGAVSVMCKAVCFFRKENPKGAGGQLLQLLSILGIQGVGRLVHYSTTKFGESHCQEDIIFKCCT